MLSYGYQIRRFNMKDTIECYLSHLWEINRKEMHDLSEEDCQTLACLLIKQTPTKMLPLFENYDRSREVILMMSEWMDSEDDYLGHQILCKMRELIVTAMEPQIEDRMEDYARREAVAVRETREHERLEGISFDKQRI